MSQATGANAVSDLERAEHLGYADSKGVKRVSIFNDGTQVNVATEENQDKLASYKTQALDDYTTTSVTYVCKMKPAGTWLFLKIDETGNFPTFTYANVSNNPTLTTYALAYAARTTATYGLLNTLTF